MPAKHAAHQIVRISLSCLNYSMRHLIIGIDPGSTIGIAAISLEGKPCKTAHVEAGGIGAAVSIIERWGTPSLIATDVRPAPDMAIKLASSFNVPLFVPQKPWREEDKRRLLKEIDERQSKNPDESGKEHVVAQNAHERDALSAAVQAWRANQNLLREALASDVPGEKKEMLCHFLLQGYRHEFAMQKIADKERLEARHEEAETDEEEKEAPEYASKASRLAHIESANAINGQVAALERANVELKKRVSMLEHERDGFAQKIRLYENGVRERMLREGEYRKMASQLEFLTRRLSEANARIAKQRRHGNRFGNMQQNPEAGKRGNHQLQDAGSGQNHHRPNEAGNPPQWQKREQLSQTQQHAPNLQKQAIRHDEAPDEDESSLKGLDSIKNLERLITQYQRRRVEEKDKD